MQAGVFAYPFMYWVGMDTDPRTSPEALVDFNHFYTTTHVHEVVAAHAGFVGASRFELAEQDPRGGMHAGPRWLAVYDMADEAAAEQYVRDNARPWLHRRKYSPWPPARKRAKTVWRMLWRRLSDAPAVAREATDSLVLVGSNVPLASQPRATQLELYRSFAHPESGCPRFCSAYLGAPAPAHADDSVWQLVYRPIPLTP